MSGLIRGAIVIGLALSSIATASPADVTVRLAAPVGEITVGDPIILLLTVAHPPGTVIEPPTPSTLWSATPKEEEKLPESLVVESVESVEPLRNESPRVGETSWRIRARLFAPGAAQVPGIRVHYRLPGSQEMEEAQTNSITVMVGSVLARPDEPPADIKGMRWLPADWKSILLWSLALLAAIVMVVWMIRRYLAKRPGSVALAPVDPAIPALSPWERAVRDLDALLASGLLARGRMKEFHVQLSEVVKRFLGGQHGFDALDRTSEEVMAHLSSSNAEVELRESAAVFLVACDLVKFAKASPDSDAVGDTVAQARRIIEMGRPHVAATEVSAA